MPPTASLRDAPRARAARLPGRWWRLLLPLLASAEAAPAEVEIAFHSRPMGSSFPHAFIVLRGTIEATGERVDANYGFTVRHQIGPSVLLGPVHGAVASESRAYVAGTRRHFALLLGDTDYHRVMALVGRWRALPQPSYVLDRRNCVSFVAAVAATLGLSAEPGGLMRRPRAFLDRVARDNAGRLGSGSLLLPHRSRDAGIGADRRARAAHPVREARRWTSDTTLPRRSATRR